MYLESIELYSNITKAAAHLFISQPYLSKVIKQLENELKIKLIQSQGHQTFLTYAGQRYLFYLKEIDMIERQMAKELYLILTPLEYGIGKTIAQFYELHHMSLNQMITTSTVPTAASLSLSGMGATFVPQTLIHRYLDKECNVYHFHKNKLFSEYIMIYKKDVELSGIALLLYKAFLTK